jgi:pyrimidine deaminase RibD-like protein
MERSSCKGRIPGDPDADWHWLETAIELSERCPPAETAFCVGAVLVSADREVEPKDHAEEVALRRARAAGAAVPSLADATLYSSLEPCIARASRPVTCAELIAAAGLRRVVIAWREPPLFVPGGGAVWLVRHGVSVIDLPDLADRARRLGLPQQQ